MYDHDHDNGHGNEPSMGDRNESDGVVQKRRAAALATAATSTAAFDRAASFSSFSPSAPHASVPRSTSSVSAPSLCAHSFPLFFAILPAALILLAIGGRPLLSVWSIFTILAYVLYATIGSDLLALACIWLGAVGGCVTLPITHSLKTGEGGVMWTLTVLLLCSTLIIHMALAISIHFPSYHFAGLAYMSERVVFSSLFLPLSSIELVACVSLFGVDYAPLMMVAILTFNYLLLIRPRAASEQIMHVQPNSSPTAKPTSSTHASMPLADMDLLVSPALTLLYTLIYILLPFTLHLLFHHYFIAEQILSAQALTLLTLPIFILSVTCKEDVLLFFIGLPRSLARLLRRVMLVGSSVCLILLLEYRILYPVFGHLLVLRANWPIACFVLLTTAVGSGMTAVGMLITGVEGKRTKEMAGAPSASASSPRIRLFQLLVHVSLFTLSLSLGLAWYLLPFSLVTSYLLARFLLPLSASTTVGVSRGLLSRLVECFGMMIVWTIVWRVIIQRLLGFVEFDWCAQTGEETSGRGSDCYFSSIVDMIWLLALLAFMLPMLLHIALPAVRSSLFHLLSSSSFGPIVSALPSPLRSYLGPSLSLPRLLRSVCEALLCCYLFLLGLLEWDMRRVDNGGASGQKHGHDSTASSHHHSTYDSQIYGPYLILLTSGLTLLLAHLLHSRSSSSSSSSRSSLISHRGYVAMIVVGVWKVGALFADTKQDLFHWLLFVAVQAPLWLPATESDSDLDDGTHDNKPTPTSQHFHAAHSGGMSPLTGLLHACSIVVVMWLCKNTILAHVLHWVSIVLGSGMGGGSGSASLLNTNEVNESTYVALFLLATSLALIPLAFKHFRHVPRYRRWNTLFIIESILFASIQPRLDFLAASTSSMAGVFALDDESDVFERGMDVLAPRWPQWMLFIALSVMVFALASATDVAASAASNVGAGRGVVPSSSILATLRAQLPRPFLSCILGLSFGLYLLGVSLPFQPLLYTLVLATSTLAATLCIYAMTSKKIASPSTGDTTAAAIRGLGMGGAVEKKSSGMLSSIIHALPNSMDMSGMRMGTILDLLYSILILLLPFTLMSIWLSFPHARIFSSMFQRVGVSVNVHPTDELAALWVVFVLILHGCLHLFISIATNAASEIAANRMSKESKMKNLHLYSSQRSMAASVGEASMRSGRGLASLPIPPVYLYIGNLATIFSFILLAYTHLSGMGSSLWIVNGSSSGGLDSDEVGSLWLVFLIAPILLLLNPDGQTWTEHIDEGWRKWCAVGSGVCLALVYVSLRAIFPPLSSLFFTAPMLRSSALTSIGWWFRCKNLILFSLTLPCILTCLRRAWRGGMVHGIGARSSSILHALGLTGLTAGWSLLLRAPLALLPLLIADISAIQLLAFVSLLAAALEWSMIATTQSRGRKII